MKSYELQPTHENILNTFFDDKISRNEDIFYFINLLNSIEGGYSISLDGEWGSGKTFFVKQVKIIMDAYNDFIQSNPDEVKKIKDKVDINIVHDFQKQICVYYDAWANDNDEDPILSMVYAIMQSIDTDFSFNKAANRSDIAAAFLEVVEVFSGTHLSKIIHSIKDYNLTGDRDILSQIKEKKEVQNIVESFLDSLLLERGNRLIIFIDELDRCKPDYAVKFLERIKHYFSNDRITYVFSLNAKELQHTIKKCYGNDFDGYKYLDRFFDLRITLKKPQNLMNYCSFFENISGSSYNILNEVRQEVIREFNFGLREISKYIYITNVAIKKPIDFYLKSLNDGREFWNTVLIAPILIGLKMYSLDMYANFISGKDCTTFINILSRLNMEYFEFLLNDDEIFSENAFSISYRSRKQGVRIKSRLKEYYEAIFVNDIEYFSGKTGTFVCNAKVKKTLIDISNLLSSDANYFLN